MEYTYDFSEVPNKFELEGSDVKRSKAFSKKTWEGDYYFIIFY